MSKLSEMIDALCPNGVEYKRFSEVCFYIRGVTYGKSQEIRNGEDGWKVLRANNITLSTNTLNYDDVKVISKNVKVKPAQLLRKGDILICAGSGSKEHVGKVAYISEDSDYTFGGFMAVVRAQNAGVDTRYLYHVLASALFINYLKSALNSTTINNLSNSVIGPFEFPLPPLPIQREIVQILDNFANLTAELTAELAKRKKQYEHYRDMLLNFEGGGRYDKFGVEWKRLGEICDMKAGYAIDTAMIAKERDRDHGYACYGANGFRGYVQSPNQFGEHCLIGRQGALCGNVCFVSNEFYATEHAVVVSTGEGVSNRYLFHLLTHMNLNQYKSQGAQPGLSVARLSKLMIPLPPLAEQERIVAILDRFDALCNSLTEGLPAEIALRKKQYAYYRDKLLSFREAS